MTDCELRTGGKSKTDIIGPKRTFTIGVTAVPNLWFTHCRQMIGKVPSECKAAISTWRDTLAFLG
jgi:hypothetical protein